ncbi:MAG: YciI family protein [Dehalococcoidia bacterium]|nr:YciI family protein [Dehalococcoidia bacterium]
MRFMVIVKANEATEAGTMPTEAQLAAMGNFNQELVDAGVMVSGEGLHPTANGFKLRYDGKGGSNVVDGPFTGAKELIAGFWIIDVPSREDAISWMKRAPMEAGDELEVRQIFESDDFGEEFTPELRAQEDRQRAAIAEKFGSS